jgi:hypothetical protein
MMPAVTDPEAPESPARPRRSLERVIRIAGLVIAVLAAVLSGLLELFFTQLRVGGFPIGVSILMALVGNVAIAWFTVTTTGRRRAVAAPWVVWTLIMFFATGVHTTEGDYLVSGDDYVALVMVLVGSLAFAVYTYRMILRRPLPAKP